MFEIAYSFNFTGAFSEMSKAGKSIFDHIVGIKDNILNIGSHFVGKSKNSKKNFVLNITKTQNNIEINFKKPVELKINYEKNNTIKIKPLLIDIAPKTNLMINNFTGVVVVNTDFKYKGFGNSILLNQNKIHLEEETNTINIEGMEQNQKDIYIKSVKIKNIDFQNISANLLILDENKMNIELNEKPLLLENFEGNIEITSQNIIFNGTIVYLKAQNFILE